MTGSAGRAPNGPLGNCPYCGRDLAYLASACPECDGDLRPLARVVDLANRHFNQAIVDARAKHWNAAAEHLAVTLALNPNDVDGMVLLGKARYHQNHHEEALEQWRRALELTPDREDVRQAISRATAVAAAPGPGRKPDPALKRGGKRH